jgi:DNA modification methylase
MTVSIVKADAIDFLRSQPADSLDLVFGSPPYEEARLYLEGGVNLGISRKTDDWVAWMVDVYRAAQQACKGLVAFVVAGQTRNYKWSAGPALLTAELHRAGLNLRNPPIYSRNSVAGSGGPDWLRSCYEWIICTTRPGKLPWSNNTAMGDPPKYGVGGEMSFRTLDGSRVNEPKREKAFKGNGRHKETGQVLKRNLGYKPPAIANPGNIIACKVGGNHMGGDEFASLNEAPFPEYLAEFFVKSFCPPGGLCCDPFSGSGTVAAVAKRNGRNFAGCDLRQSQVDLGLKRVAAETPPLFV